MEIFHSIATPILSAVVVLCVWKMLDWIWFKPKKLENLLRKQGFNGNHYSFLFGDTRDMTRMTEEAKSKPMDISNEIIPRIIPSFHKAFTEYGPNCFLWFGPKPGVFLCDSDVIREVLSKNYDFHKAANPIFDRLVQGILAYDADKWAKHRRLINPAFHIDKLKHMLPAFYLCCHEMLSKWERIIPSEGSCEVDVWPYLQTLMSDAISRTAFGSSYEEGRKIFDIQKQQAELVVSAGSLAFVPGFKFFPTKTNRKMQAIAKEVESSIIGIIDKRMKTMNAGEACSGDLLGLLLESNFKEIQKHGDKSGMSLHDVIEECKLFYFAGQETTSSLLVWTMILLSKHSDWQARAREEVMQAFGKDIPDFQMLNHLKIVTMILQEALRLYPPAPMMARRIHKETAIGKLVLPAGVQLMLPVILFHHNREIWGADVMVFNPERFNEGFSQATGGKLSYLPFGYGPRICIGQNFAMLEAKLALSMILLNYSFELSPSYSHAPLTVITLQPQHGAHLILHKL